jgi:Fe(3+) dicitrate transport protein
MADNYRWYVSQGLQAQLFGFASTGPLEHEIEAGVRLHYDEANRLHSQHEYRMVGADANFSGTLQRTQDPVVITAENRGQTHALALHVVDTIELEKLTLTPGLRSEVVWTRYTDQLVLESENRSTQFALLPGMGGLKLKDPIYVWPRKDVKITAEPKKATAAIDITLPDGTKYEVESMMLGEGAQQLDAFLSELNQ